MTDLGAVIADYYPRIDACDFDWVLRLFAHDAVYQRADAHYTGIGEIEHFFRVERQIRGRHDVAEIWPDTGRGTVWATGVFEGHGADGDHRRVGFADLWRFNGAALVEQRQTYLAIGNEYVRR